MRFDASKGDTGEVYDANGTLLDRPIRGDTATGIVECYGEDGKIFIARYPFPLTVKNFRRGGVMGHLSHKTERK